MNGKIRAVFFICLGLLFGMSVMYIYKNFIDKGDANIAKTENVSYGSTSAENQLNAGNTASQDPIEKLTEERTVISYVKQNHRLPDYYITKMKPGNKAGILQKEIFAMYSREKLLEEINLVTVKEGYRMEKSTLKRM